LIWHPFFVSEIKSYNHSKSQLRRSQLIIDQLENGGVALTYNDLIGAEYKWKTRGAEQVYKLLGKLTHVEIIK